MGLNSPNGVLIPQTFTKKDQKSSNFSNNLTNKQLGKWAWLGPFCSILTFLILLFVISFLGLKIRLYLNQNNLTSPPHISTCITHIDITHYPHCPIKSIISFRNSKEEREKRKRKIFSKQRKKERNHKTQIYNHSKISFLAINLLLRAVKS